jgi:hypothetical protein
MGVLWPLAKRISPGRVADNCRSIIFLPSTIMESLLGSHKRVLECRKRGVRAVKSMPEASADV